MWAPHDAKPVDTFLDAARAALDKDGMVASQDELLEYYMREHFMHSQDTPQAGVFGMSSQAVGVVKAGLGPKFGKSSW